MLTFILALLTTYSHAHGFLSVPVSRNAVGNSKKGYCTWLGKPPCFGDYMSLGCNCKRGCNCKQCCNH